MRKGNFKKIEVKMSRRQILKAGIIGGAALFWHGDTLFGLFGGSKVALAAIPGGTLDPKTVPKYITPLVIPPAMPNTGLNTYSIAVKQFQQQILPAPLPVTTVWSYGASNNLGTLNYPAFTIEAVRGAPTTVTWINGLVDTSGNYLPHLLPVDPTLHWANPPGGPMGRDMRPIFASTPGPYTYATEGTWFAFFQSKAGGGWAPGTAEFVYPNSQRPSTAWYHDHTLGMTRVNVYAGPAGFYIIRSENPNDNPTGILPGPAPQLGDAPDTTYYEIPLAIQDRSFDLGGALFYPDNRAFFDGFIGPFIPQSDVSPIWNPEFFGNHMVVNGNTWPFLNVEPRRYRFRGSPPQTQ